MLFRSLYTIRDYINVPLFIEAQVSLTSGYNNGNPTWSGRLLLYKYSSNYIFNSVPTFQDYKLQTSAGISFLAAGASVTDAIGSSQTATITYLDNQPKIGDSYIWAFTSEDSLSSITASDIYVNVKLANTSVFGLAQTGSNNLVFYSPYLPKPFEGGDYDSIYGNVDVQEPSLYIEKLDPNYLTNSLLFQAMISGSSPKADVKDYYYNLRRHVYPRYLGSRITSDDFNLNSITQSITTQNTQSIWLNPASSLPNPPLRSIEISSPAVASKFDTTLYEFNFIDSPPQIMFTSRININQIINTDTTESAIILLPNDERFGFTKDNQFIPSSKLKNLTFYQPTAFTNLTPEVLTTRITPDEEIYIYSPSITNGPSSFTSYGVSNTGNVWFGYQSPNASDPLYNGPI